MHAAEPELVILDVMLPDEDGYQILGRLRETAATRTVPVIMVTAKTSEIDVVKGLDHGADDYLCKPFGIMEFISRVKAVLRRAAAAAPAPADDTPAARGRFRQRCEIVANTYLLSRRESEVMYYLARGYKSSHIQQQLYISEGTAKTHIRHIYRKLNIHSQQDLIHLIDEVEL